MFYTKIVFFFGFPIVLELITLISIYRNMGLKVRCSLTVFERSAGRASRMRAPRGAALSGQGVPPGGGGDTGPRVDLSPCADCTKKGARSWDLTTSRGGAVRRKRHGASQVTGVRENDRP